jgi:hypothetical protein
MQQLLIINAYYKITMIEGLMDLDLLESSPRSLRMLTHLV